MTWILLVTWIVPGKGRDNWSHNNAAAAGDFASGPLSFLANDEQRENIVLSDLRALCGESIIVAKCWWLSGRRSFSSLSAKRYS